MNIASLFNLAGPDLLIILVIVLLLFGAKKLPELARGLGQAVREFSKAKDEFEREVTRPPEAASQPQRLPEPSVPPPASTVAQDSHEVSHEVSHDVHDQSGDQAQQPHTHVI
jgi:sec-independent protein translocase protein TatA